MDMEVSSVFEFLTHFHVYIYIYIEMGIVGGTARNLLVGGEM